MTPKEKAEELFEKYYRLFNNFPNYQYVIENLNTIQDEKLYITKQCALIAVDNILETTKVKWATQRKLPNGEWILWKGISYRNYWVKVKQEIKKI